MEEDQGDPLPQRSDHSLLRRFREGEQDAATQLFLRYAQRLQSLAASQTSSALATRFDPEDVVQSVFRTFFRRASTGLYDVPEGDELWQLLLVLALNKIRSLGTFHRAQKRDVGRTTRPPDMTSMEIAQGGRGEQGPPMRILQMVVDEFLERQPATHATVARMRMEGYQVDEIATATKRSKRTIERVLAEMRGALLRDLEMRTDDV